MKRIIISCILLVLALALTACAAPVPQESATAAVPAANAPTEAPAENADTASIEPLPDAANEATVPVEPSAAPADEKKNAHVDAKLTEEDALKAAYADAALSAEEQQSAKVTKNHLDREDGFLVYEIEFWLGNVEYEYDVDAESGAIRKSQKEKDNDKASDATSDGVIDEAAAAAIVLKKVPGAGNEHLRIELDRDDGRLVYEGEIRYQGMEYEFELDAASGSILEWDEERDD